MTRRSQVLVGLGVGCLAFTWCAMQAPIHGHALFDFRSTGGDFYQIWLVARSLISGANPYIIGCPFSPPCARGPQYYPATAGAAVLPFGLLPAGVAAALFVGCSAAILGYAIARTGIWRAPMLLSWPFVVGVGNGQWAPLLVAAALLPGMQWLYPVKPQLGLALWLYRPSWRAVVGGALLLVVSLVLMPSWPLQWWAAASHSPYVRTPLRWAWFAPVLLAAALRWRTPEGRLLLAMAILPQTPFAYDQLALWLIPRTHREGLFLTYCSWFQLAAWWMLSGFDWRAGTVVLTSWAPYLIAGLYLPCLVMVLRRANTAETIGAARAAATPSASAA